MIDPKDKKIEDAFIPELEAAGHQSPSQKKIKKAKELEPAVMIVVGSGTDPDSRRAPTPDIRRVSVRASAGSGCWMVPWSHPAAGYSSQFGTPRKHFKSENGLTWSQNGQGCRRPADRGEGRL